MVQIGVDRVLEDVVPRLREDLGGTGPDMPETCRAESSKFWTEWSSLGRTMEAFGCGYGR